MQSLKDCLLRIHGQCSAISRFLGLDLWPGTRLWGISRKTGLLYQCEEKGIISICEKAWSFNVQHLPSHQSGDPWTRSDPLLSSMRPAIDSCLLREERKLHRF